MPALLNLKYETAAQLIAEDPERTGRQDTPRGMVKTPGGSQKPRH
jgi:hypothetical protein